MSRANSVDPYLESLAAHDAYCSSKSTCAHPAHRPPRPRLRRRAERKWKKLCKRVDKRRARKDGYGTKEALDLNRKIELAVLKYIVKRDNRRCGICGNTRRRWRFSAITIVPDGIVEFDVSASGKVSKRGNRWHTRAECIDNVQAGCIKQCKSTGLDAKNWRRADLVLVPVAESPLHGDYYFLPHHANPDGTAQA